MYDVAADTASFGRATVDGRALVWQLDRDEGDAEGALESRFVQLDPFASWIVRCDRIDFPLGGIAHRHTHPGPGIRYLLRGELEIETEGRSRFYGPGGAWFESGPEPVVARASVPPRDVVRPRARAPRRVGRQADDPVRRPRSTRRRRSSPPPSISSTRSPCRCDARAARSLRRAAARRPARRPRRRSRVRRAGRELHRRPRRVARQPGSLRHVPARGGRGQHGRGVREADGTPGDLLRDPRPGRDAGVGRGAHGVPGRDADDPARRSDPSPRRGAGGLPGARLPARLRLAREVGRTGRPGGADPRARRSGVQNGDVRPARARRARAARGHARRARGGAGRVALRPGAGVAGRARARRAPAAARDGRATARDRRRSAVDGRGRKRSSGAGSRRAACPSLLPGAARTTSTTSPAATPAI